jgi:hypothetical protein
MALAPVILFAYNRPIHTKKTLVSLKQNYLANQSTLYIYIDGPKVDASGEQKNKIDLVKQIVKEDNWCKEVIIIESNTNKGLALSVTDGVTSVISKYGKVIVLEDDLITAPLFLTFMNNSLEFYKSNDDVACISGYVYPLKEKFNSAYFLKGADCWGWATWENKWKKVFENEPEKLYKELNDRKLVTEFNFNNTYPYLQMLKDRIDSKNQSWAILWYASAFLQNKYCLYPPSSFLQNIGNDGTGTHSISSTNLFDVHLNMLELPSFPDKVAENLQARKAFELFFHALTGSKKKTVLQTIKHKIKNLTGK